MASNVRITDGSWNWIGGVDSGKVPTIASELFPEGLRRNQLAWATNATMRGGGILPRTGWIRRARVHPGNALYQGGWLYDNFINGTFPYLILSIGGDLYQVRVDLDDSVANLSTIFGLSDPASVSQAYFTQGEEFMIKQAGDGVTLPLIWDGTRLRRSTGPGGVVGVIAAGFNVPAVGDYQDVTLYGPYTGVANQVVLIDGESWIQVVNTQSITLRNDAATAPVGYIVPAGTQILDAGGNLLCTTLASFTVPAVGATTAFSVWVDPAVAAPQAVTIFGDAWTITVVAPEPAPAANHVYLVNVTATPGDPVAADVNLLTVSELPAATAMDYYMGRIWYAQDRQYTAGDIVLGPAGTLAYAYRDSILKVTENPLALAGDGFVVPTSDGIIRALRHTANLDTALGEGQLFACTRKTIYSLSVPVTRSAWITATEPLQRVAQLRNGSYGERSIVNINGDLFYLSWDGYRSLFMAVRDFSQWGNTPISRNLNRLLNFNDRALLSTASGIYFDNRMLQTVLPEVTEVGTAFGGLAVLDFDLVSSLEDIIERNRQAPAWEGWWQGVKILQLFEGDYGGLQRAFAVILAQDGGIEVWELTSFTRNDEGDNRVEWFVETPAWTWGREFELKRLDGGEIWVDRVYGTVYMDVYYRPDAEACWQFWYRTEFCSARSTCEDLENPVCYPEQAYGEGYKFPVTLPKPPHPGCNQMNSRPMDIGYQFQMKIVMKGWCRIRGIMVHATPWQKAPYQGLTCATPASTL
jgi:hypothetical protein